MTTWKVTGATAFMGYAPGETFDADLDDDLAARAVERGSIEKAKPATKKEKGEADDA